MTRIARILGPVPPLDDAARARMEHAVLDGLERPAPAGRRRWVWPAAGGLALAAAAALVWLVVRPSEDAPGGSARFAGPTELSWHDATITVEDGGAIVTGRDAVTLERGAARFVVAHRDGAPFRVRAGDVTIEDVGTEFRVTLAGDDVTVEVDEGEVDIAAGATTTRVGAGERWPAITAVAPPPPSPVPPPVVSPPAAAPPAAEPPEPIRPAKPAKAPDPSARYEAAARLERSDPTAALAIYRKLARRSDSWGAIALFALARLEAAGGDTAAARTDLAAYLRRFPDGANAADVRRMLKRQ